MANASALLGAGIDFSDTKATYRRSLFAPALANVRTLPGEIQQQTERLAGLVLDGQINGTSEYEEAAAKLRSATARQGPAAGQYP